MGIFTKVSESKEDLMDSTKTVVMSSETHKLLDKERGLKAKIIIMDEIPYQDLLSFKTKKEEWGWQYQRIKDH